MTRLRLVFIRCGTCHELRSATSNRDTCEECITKAQAARKALIARIIGRR